MTWNGLKNGKMTGWVWQKIWIERKVIGDVPGSEAEENALGFLFLHHLGGT